MRCLEDLQICSSNVFSKDNPYPNPKLGLKPNPDPEKLISRSTTLPPLGLSKKTSFSWGWGHRAGHLWRPFFSGWHRCRPVPRLSFLAYPIPLFRRWFSLSSSRKMPPSWRLFQSHDRHGKIPQTQLMIGWLTAPTWRSLQPPGGVFWHLDFFPEIVNFATSTDTMSTVFYSRRSQLVAVKKKRRFLCWPVDLVARARQISHIPRVHGGFVFISVAYRCFLVHLFPGSSSHHAVA